MKIHVIFKLFSLSLVFLISLSVFADIHHEQDVQNFINEMVEKHGFDKDRLNTVFSKVKISSSILDAISRPAESLPWYKYRQIFIRNDRIQLGRKFIEKNKELLISAEKEYGVPPEIIAAIIGVETRYGNNTGAYKVIDSLVTLGFNYPKRANFFRSELEQFLLLVREQGLDPNSVMGSYAGAMGIPQFISSSYRNYAVDFDNDGLIDIWENPADAIGSVANYFKMHGWERGQDITFNVVVTGNNYEEVLGNSLAPDRTFKELKHYGISTNAPIADDVSAKLLMYELEKGEEFWLGLNNFYVITRYNHSALYAMAVYQLAQEILQSTAN
jgi:membrane-bound lytic murein transglycosylase B